MKKIRWWLELNRAGEIYEGEFAISNAASEESIENEARKQAFDGINWGYEVVKEPVGFMEAVESGKRFRVEHELLKGLFEHTNPNNIFALSSFIESLKRYFLSKDIRKILTEGKFYIED